MSKSELKKDILASSIVLGGIVAMIIGFLSMAHVVFSLFVTIISYHLRIK